MTGREVRVRSVTVPVYVTDGDAGPVTEARGGRSYRGGTAVWFLIARCPDESPDHSGIASTEDDLTWDM